MCVHVCVCLLLLFLRCFDALFGNKKCIWPIKTCCRFLSLSIAEICPYPHYMAHGSSSFTMTVYGVSVEYKGHRLLDSAKQADVGHVKKQVSSELVNFKHPFTGDAALVCYLFV